MTTVEEPPDRDGERAILWPGLENNPATMVAAVGAADLLAEAGHDGVHLRWVATDVRHAPAQWRPEITFPGGGPRSPMQALATAIAKARVPDRSRYPGGGRGQTIAGAVSLVREPAESYANALMRVHAELRAAGHAREAALLAGVLGYERPHIDGGGPGALRRMPLAIGAKSDLRAATEGWARARPLTAEEVEDELRGEQWRYVLRSGDWGLDAIMGVEARGHANSSVRLGSVVLARLLTQGIIASGRVGPRSVWMSHPRQRIPNRIAWPIWTLPLPLAHVRGWEGWPFEATPVVDWEYRARVQRVPSAVKWQIADSYALNRMISVYWWGEDYRSPHGRLPKRLRGPNLAALMSA